MTWMTASATYRFDECDAPRVPIRKAAPITISAAPSLREVARVIDMKLILPSWKSKGIITPPFADSESSADEGLKEIAGREIIRLRTPAENARGGHGRDPS